MQPIVTKRKQATTKFLNFLNAMLSLTTFLASSDLTQSLYVNEVEVIHHSSYRAKKTSFNNKYFM
jgi:hypothetical protein